MQVNYSPQIGFQFSNVAWELATVNVQPTGLQSRDILPPVVQVTFSQNGVIPTPTPNPTPTPTPTPSPTPSPSPTSGSSSSTSSNPTSDSSPG